MKPGLCIAIAKVSTSDYLPYLDHAIGAAFCTLSIIRVKTQIHPVQILQVHNSGWKRVL